MRTARLCMAASVVAVVAAVSRVWADQNEEADKAKGGAAKQAYVGVAVEAVPAALAAHLPNLPAGQGLLVTRVMPGSPAESAGVRVHDVLVVYGDQKLLSANQFIKLVRAGKSGDEVALEILRGGKPDEVRIQLGERETPRGADVIERFGALPPRLRLRLGEDRKAEHEDGAWSRFESMILKSIDGDRLRAELHYKDEQGKAQEWSFEGTRDEIRKELEENKDVPAEMRARLLRSLEGAQRPGLRSSRLQLMLPPAAGRIMLDAEALGLPGEFSVEELLEELRPKLDAESREQLRERFRGFQEERSGEPERIRL